MSFKLLPTMALLLLFSGVRANRVHDLVVKGQAVLANGVETSPVKRVVEVLEKMKTELSAEADKESEMYDKMVCWCETNTKEKTQAIADADAKDQELSSQVETGAARRGELAVQIASLKDQIAQDSAALEQATTIREKAADKFRGEEKDIVQIITNLRNAIAVLAKHHGSTFVQLDAPLVAGLRVLLRDAALKYEMLRVGDHGARTHQGMGSELLQTLQKALHAPEDVPQNGRALRSALLEALDVHGGAVTEMLPLDIAQHLVAQALQPSAGAKAAPGSFFQKNDRQPIDAAYKSYSPRSSEIYGILTQMLEEFEAELGEDQQAEETAIVDYKALAKTKSEQITLGKEKLDQLEEDFAGTKKALADAKEDLDLVRKQRSEDVEFLRNLKLTCNDLDKEWERRSKTRDEELKAVTETIAILTEDDNRELLAKTVSLLQENSESLSSASAARRMQAISVLRRAARAPEFEMDDLLSAWRGRVGNQAAHVAAGPRGQLSALAVAAQLDDFTEVKALMDKLLAELKAQQQEEAEFKAYCIKELDENEKMTYSKTQHKEDLEQKVSRLSAMIDKLGKEISEAKSTIAVSQVEIKKASQLREAENAVFQKTVEDQRATQGVLTQALTRLRDFYEKSIGKKVMYLQRDRQTPPVQFTKYKVNAGSSPAMGLLEMIIGDSKALVDEASAAEYKAQADYETFVKDSNAVIENLSLQIAAKKRSSSEASIVLSETENGIISAKEQLESLDAAKADLHAQCDFVLKNFDIRQKARLQEMEAIQAAKAILSGAQGER